MAITQQRMVELIRAGQDYQQALEKLMRLVALDIKDVRNGKKTPLEAIDSISLYDQLFLLLSDPLKSATTLKLEAEYFRRNFNRNKAAAIWQANSRARRGLGAGASAPAPRPRPPTKLALDLDPDTQAELDGTAGEDFPANQPLFPGDTGAGGFDVDAELRAAEEYLAKHPRPSTSAESE